MATYDLITIKTALDRHFGKDIPLAKLQAALDKPTWLPVLNRMIAVSDTLEDLPNSDRYGMFRKMSEMGEYQISSGRWKFARPLNAAELANCF